MFSFNLFFNKYIECIGHKKGYKIIFHIAKMNIPIDYNQSAAVFL